MTSGDQELVARVPPQSEEAERGVLGAILLDAGRCMDVVLKKNLAPAAFYFPAHRETFAVMRTMADERAVIDLLTLSERMREMKLLDQVGGSGFLERLIDGTPTAAHCEHYLAIVWDRWMKRRIVEECRNAVDAIYATDEKAEQVLSTTMNRLNDLGDGIAEPVRSNVDVFDALVQQFEFVHDRRTKGEQVPLPGLETPFERWNELLGGLRPGLHFLAGPPSAGKTSFEGQLTDHVALFVGGVLKIYLDDTHEDALGRICARQARVSLPKLQHGFATQKNLAAVKDIRGMVGQMQMWVVEDCENVEKAAVLARIYKAKYDIKLVVVDYVQVMDTENERRNQQERERLDQVCKKLKQLWKELRIPVVALSQVVTKGKDKAKATAQMDDLFGSSGLAQTASSVTILRAVSQEDVAPQPIDDDHYAMKVAVTADVVKNKHGPKGQMFLWFHEKYFFFEELPFHVVKGARRQMTYKEHIPVMDGVRQAAERNRAPDWARQEG